MFPLHAIFPILPCPAKVFRQSFWMRGFGAKTPKRTTLWSNSSAVRFFCTTKKARGRGKASPKLADTYRDRHGRKRFKGNKNLRKSQFEAYLCQPAWFDIDLTYCMHLFPKSNPHMWAKGISNWIWSSVCCNHETLQEGKVPSYKPKLCILLCSIIYLNFLTAFQTVVLYIVCCHPFWGTTPWAYPILARDPGERLSWPLGGC